MLKFLFLLIYIIFYSNLAISQDINLKNIDSQILKNYLNSEIHEYKLILENQNQEKVIKNFKKIENLKFEISANHNALIKSGFLNSLIRLDSMHLVNNRLDIYYYQLKNKKFECSKVNLISEQNDEEFQFLENTINKNFIFQSNLDFDTYLKQISYIDIIHIDHRMKSDSTYDVNYYLKIKKSNTINGIIGLLPNSYNTSELNLTADVKLNLINIAQKGISLDLNWQKSLLNSQFLYLNANIPHVLNTPLGIQNYFNLEKIDSNFLRISYSISFIYLLNHAQSFSLILKNQISSIQSFNKLEVQSGKLPKYLDYSIPQIGFGYNLNTTDAAFFNKKGWKLNLYSLIGNKNISKNQKITSIKDPQGMTLDKIYDSIQLSVLQNSNSIEVEKYSSLSRHTILKNKIDLKNINSSVRLENEAYYIGGINGPRGFDDKSIVTSNYINFSNELQLYLSKNMYSTIFVELAFIEKVISREIENINGFGIGLNIRNKSSIIEVNLANGYSRTQSIQLNQSKIHLRYVNLF